MCSVLAGITALSGVMQYKAQQEQADAQAASYRAQAEADIQNAKIENRRMEQDADNYARESEKLRARQRIIEGQQRAQAGSAGLSMAGSALDILSSGYDAYNQDKETLLSNQRNDNFNRRVTEGNYLHRADSNYAAANNVESLAKAQGAATILGTAASIVGMGFSGGGSGSTSGNTASASGSGMGGGFDVPTSVSSNIGNTTASWNLGSGYSVSRNWGNNANLGYFNKKNYFGYR